MGPGVTDFDCGVVSVFSNRGVGRGGEVGVQ